VADGIQTTARIAASIVTLAIAGWVGFKLSMANGQNEEVMRSLFASKGNLSTSSPTASASVGTTSTATTPPAPTAIALSSTTSSELTREAARSIITGSPIFLESSVPYPFARHIIGITGISRSSPNLAEVEMQWSFVQAEGSNDPYAATAVSHVANSELTLKLFDDGWRVEKFSNPNGVDDMTQAEHAGELDRLRRLFIQLAKDTVAARHAQSVPEGAPPAPPPSAAAEANYYNSGVVIQKHCTSRYPTDFDMRAFCEDQQRKAVTKLQATSAPTGMSYTDFAIIRDHCVSRYPEDYDMRAFCEGQQFEGWRKTHGG
jgi:hypothetical protein